MRTSLWLLTAALASPAAAQPVVVRLGTHDGFGRVVFEFEQSQAFTTERSDNALLLHFPAGGDIPDVPGTARNIAAVTGGGGLATITLRPSSRLRVARLGKRVVVDVLDPAPAKPPASRTAAAKQPVAAPVAERPGTAPEPGAAVAADRSATVSRPVPQPMASPVPPDAPPARSPPAVPTPTPASSISVPATPASSTPAMSTPASLPAEPPVATPATTLALAAVPAPSAAGPGDGAAMLPFGPTVAAASFRHGEEAWVVFDDPRPIDVAALAGDPAFADATVDLLPSATLLRFKLPASRVVQLQRQPEGWSVIAKDGPANGPIVMPSSAASRLLFAAASPGQVVVVPDRATGRNLLIGTVRAAGPGVPVTMHVPEFAIYPSWQGVVVEPVSDRVALRAVPEGFVVTTGGPLAVALEQSASFANAAVLTRRFDFPAEPVATSAPPPASPGPGRAARRAAQARLAARKAAAQTMLALGLGPEARIAAPPRRRRGPTGMRRTRTSMGLTAIGALLSHRPDEAGGLQAPALDGSDETALWRGVRVAMTNPASPEAAQVFAATAGLVLAYPSALRTRLLPVVAETLVAGGAGKAADAMLASLPDEPLVAFARAARLEQKAETDAALTAYDALAIGRDRLVSARAATRAAYLRLATGRITPADAVKTLEQRFADWRGDARERDLRLRTADIAAQAGDWRKAFSILKDTAELFPESAADIAAKMTAMMSTLLHGPGASQIKPLDLVSLAEENASTIAQADTSGMVLLLADKLTALDLPARAGAVIERMVSAAPPGDGRAALGARLATLRLSEQDPAAAAAALSATEAADMSAGVRDDRLMVDARVHAMMNDRAGAAAILAKLGTSAADEARATILAEDGDWHGAALALDSVAATKLPDTGPLGPEQQDFVLRLVSAHSQAGDEAALQNLAAKQAGRMSGARAEMFRLLTSAPVSRMSDLRRIGGEVAMARALPSSLAAIGTR